MKYVEPILRLREKAVVVRLFSIKLLSALCALCSDENPVCMSFSYCFPPKYKPARFAQASVFALCRDAGMTGAVVFLSWVATICEVSWARPSFGKIEGEALYHGDFPLYLQENERPKTELF